MYAICMTQWVPGGMNLLQPGTHLYLQYIYILHIDAIREMRMISHCGGPDNLKKSRQKIS